MTITDCMAGGKVYSGGKRVGGFFGDLFYDNKGLEINNSFSYADTYIDNKLTGDWRGRAEDGGVTTKRCAFLKGDKDDGADIFSERECEAGAITFYLNQGRTGIDAIWRQNIGKDIYPVVAFSKELREAHKEVYKSGTWSYTNNPDEDIFPITPTSASTDTNTAKKVMVGGKLMLVKSNGQTVDISGMMR